MKLLHRAPLISFFVLAYLFSWSAFGAGILTADPAEEMLGMRGFILLGSFGPALAALVMLSTGSEPRQALKSWLLSVVRVKAHPLVYFIALLLPALVATLVMTLMGIAPLPSHPALMVYITMLAMAPINSLAGVFLGAGPLGEEPGWRGYALPRLLARMGDLKQSFVLGTLWAAWHLPVMIVLPEWRGDIGLASFMPVYLIGVISATYVATKIWRWSYGSVFLAIWFHGLINYVGGYAFSRGIWTVADYSDLQLGALQTLTFVLTALIVALIARTEFARSRSQWLEAARVI